MAKLYLVRHALAREADDLRLPGDDVSLLPAGEAQARLLADRLRDMGPSAIYASDARRARQTAEAIGLACALPVTVLPALREIDFGDWAGRTYEAVVAADPAAAAYFTDPEAMTPPGSEPARDGARRVLGVLETIGMGPGGVVVGHGGSLRLALALALGMPLAAAWRLRLDCAHVSVLDWAAAGPLVEVLNDGCHL